MPYTLKFSDLSKTARIIVPDMPPGINAVDTTLNLVGRGYPNYGEAFAENFLHLLENFASSLPPQNPIEGQLWYDTSDPANKKLRIMDGTATSARWPSATGIYQQALDPKNALTAGLKTGDMWVDTTANQLKIYNNNNWTLVGPQSVGTTTGAIPAQIEDAAGTPHWIIKNVVDGDVVSIIANAVFTPRIVIEGFSTLKTGVTTSTKNGGIFNGTADKANALVVLGNNIPSSDFLRKNDTATAGQVISGNVIFRTNSNQLGSQGRDGIVINITNSNATDYVQLYKNNNDGVLLNSTPGGQIIIKTMPSLGSALSNTVTIEHGSVGINTSTNALSPSLDVYGTVQISDTLTLLSTSTAAMNVVGGIKVGKNIEISNNLQVTGTTNIAGQLSVGAPVGNGTIIAPANSDQYDIGSPSNYFRTIYVAEIVGAATNFPGMITAFAGDTAPFGWLLCDGTSLPINNYPALFAIIGYKYGGALTVFSLPDLSTTVNNIVIHHIIKT